MEGFLVRLPAPEFDTKSTSMRRRPSKNEATRFTRNKRVIAGRVLYYTLGEGYLTGYLSPTDVEPVETFQLTAHTVDVDVMYSTQVFQVFARRLSSPVAVASRPAIIPRSDRSDSSSDDDNEEEEAADETYPDDCNSRIELDGDYSVVFFAATKELVRTWSSKILNWNRYVFSDPSVGGGFASEGDTEDSEALQDAHEAVVQAFRASCVGEMFSPRVQLRPSSAGGIPSPPPSPPKVGESPSAPVPLQTTAPSGMPATDVEKLPTGNDPPPRPWWTLTSQSRRISSHSLHR